MRVSFSIPTVLEIWDKLSSRLSGFSGSSSQAKNHVYDSCTHDGHQGPALSSALHAASLPKACAPIETVMHLIAQHGVLFIFSIGGYRFDITSCNSLRHRVFVMRRIKNCPEFEMRRLKKTMHGFLKRLSAHRCGILRVHVRRGRSFAAVVTRRSELYLHVPQCSPTH